MCERESVCVFVCLCFELKCHYLSVSLEFNVMQVAVSSGLCSFECLFGAVVVQKATVCVSEGVLSLKWKVKMWSDILEK